MAETDIFNPTDWAGAGLSFNPNPSYSTPLEGGSNMQTSRARMGQEYSREVSNLGHSFTMQWLGTSPQIKDRVVKFYHDYKFGYFTYTDIDGNGRQYVGRFISVPKPLQTSNGKWNIQGVVFEEMPTARMLTYPADFAIDGHLINSVDDYLSPTAATMVGTWVSQMIPGSTGSASDPTQYEAFDAIGAVGDWAQVGYIGWGFQMTLRCANTLGLVNIYLDGTLLVAGLDLSNGASAAINAPASVSPVSVGGVLKTLTVAATDVPLDMHRVKVYAAGPSAVAAGTSILFPQLEYIY